MDAVSIAPVLPTAQGDATRTKSKLLDRVRFAARALHFSLKTDVAYVHWARRYILFHHKRHAAEMHNDDRHARPHSGRWRSSQSARWIGELGEAEMISALVGQICVNQNGVGLDAVT